MSHRDINLFFSELEGSQLSSVEFVQDYLQIRFDGPCINVLNPLTVNASSESKTSWEPGFRDLLCGQIAKVVRSVSYLADQEIVINFEDNSKVSISLQRKDYSSSEAIYASGFND